MAYKRGVLTESNIHKIFISAVQLFYNGNQLRQKLLKLYVVIFFFGYGISAYSQNSNNKLSKTRKWVKRTILKNLNFLPYIEYLPLINDLIRMAAIQITAQLLHCSRTPEASFFSSGFIQMLSFVLLGIGVYWLIIRKIIIS